MPYNLIDQHGRSEGYEQPFGSGFPRCVVILQCTFHFRDIGTMLHPCELVHVYKYLHATVRRGSVMWEMRSTFVAKNNQALGPDNLCTYRVAILYRSHVGVVNTPGDNNILGSFATFRGYQE